MAIFHLLCWIFGIFYTSNCNINGYFSTHFVPLDYPTIGSGGWGQLTVGFTA